MAETIFKQMYEPPAPDERDEEEAVCDDASVDAADLPAAAELTFEEKLGALNRCVMRHPLNREILYKALAFCEQERPLREAEDFIASLPQFASATQNQYYLLTSLVKAYGLDLVERDEEGGIVTPEMKEGLTEDEVDDLVAELSFKTTEVGRYFVEYNKPAARLVDLLGLAPERADTYIELLEYVGAEPRTYGQVEELLAGRPALETVIDGRRETMQPSVFVDKLERAGALIWNKGWTLTEEGREFLEDLKVNGQAQ